MKTPIIVWAGNPVRKVGEVRQSSEPGDVVEKQPVQEMAFPVMAC
jgi:hypothetical protein